MRSVAWLRSGERGKRGETISPRFCITKPRVRCSFRLCYNGYPELTVSLLACIRRGDDFFSEHLCIECKVRFYNRKYRQRRYDWWIVPNAPKHLGA